MSEPTDFVLDPHTHEGNPAAKIVFALERLSHVFRIHWWEQNKQFPLSPLQMQLLTAIRFQADLDSISALAAYLELTSATVSDAVRVLSEKEYVRKQADSADGRRQRLTLTAAGINAAEQLALFANEIGEFVQSLPNQAVFLESLLQLMQMLQANGYIALQQMCTACRHFRYTEAGTLPYYCQLLDAPLAARDLRIHCPEFEAA